MKLNKLLMVLLYIILCKEAYSKQIDYDNKIIIAHRGSSGYLPEHTLESKALAFAQGADYLEQDLVMTKDNKLLVIHDHFLDEISDVAQVYPNKARSDGKFYVMDFTLDEIKKLKVTSNFKNINGIQIAIFPNRFPLWKSNFHFHTFEEELEFIQGLEKTTGKKIGIYTEIKSPWLHHRESKDIAIETLKVLKKYGYTKKKDKVYLQTFDFNEIKRIKKLLNKMNMNIKLIQLIAHNEWEETLEKNKNGQWVNYDYNWMIQQKGALKKINEYADGIAPAWDMLIDKNNSKLGNLVYTQLSEEIKNYNKQHSNRKLEIHPYTVRKDELPNFFNDVDEFFLALFKSGATGIFTDFPDLGVKFVNKYFK